MPLDLLEKLDAGVELLGRADEPPSITVPPTDEARLKRRQRVAEFDADLNPFSGSEFGRGVAKGALGMGASTAGFGEALAGLVGADSAKAWLKEKGDSLEELNRSIPQAVESFTQIRNPADVAAYTLAAIGELAPQIVTSLGAGLGLRAAGMGVKTAAVIGAAATSYPQEAGGIYRGIREETGQDAPLTALAFGAPAAALDTLTPARFLGKVFDSASDELKSKTWGALVKRSFSEAAKAAPIEGLTEGLQESIAISANKFADQTYVMVNGTNFIRVLDAGIKGVIGGGVLGFSAPILGSAIGKDGEAVPPQPNHRPIAEQPTGNESLTANQPATQPQQVAPPTPEISRETEPAPAAEFASSGNVNTVTVPPEAATVTALDPSVVSVVEVPVASISLSQDVKNFKADADPITGVVAGQRLEGRFERLGLAPIVLWRRRNGALEVITGRHRLDLARRNGEKTIPSQIVDEASGFTREQALVFDAVSNIRDGQGSVEDYAHFFRNTPNITETEARQGGLLSRAKGRSGWDIGKFASEDVFGLYQAGKINEAQAVVIARSAPNNGPIQQLGSKLALDGRPAEYIRARLERERGRTESPTQTDMFGTAVFDEAKADEEADRVVAIRSDLRRRLQAVTGAAKNPSLAAAEGVDVRNPEQLRQRIESIKAEQERWDGAWWLQPDLVAQVRASPTPTPAVAPPVPTLRPGESGTGDLFQTADAPFNLAGETAVDTARVEAERVARQKLEEEANAIAASRQTDMPLASVAANGWDAVSGVPSLTVEQVQSAVADLSQRYGVTVEVLPSPPTSLDPQYATAGGITFADGRVQLFASNIQEAEAARVMFFHEVAVHLGIQRAAKTPAEQRQLTSIANSVAPRMMRMADEIARRAGYNDFKALAERYGFDMATPEGRERAVFELLAREAQRYAAMKTPPSWWRSFIGKLKAWLGRIFRFDIGDDGVYAIVTKGLSRAGQAQRGATAAQTQPPLASLGPTLKAADLEKTIAFTPDPATQTTEAIMASGQVTDILGMFRNWINQLVPASWRERVQGVTEFQRLGGVNDYIAGTLMLDPRTFVQAKAQMPNDGMRTLMDLHLSSGMNYVEARAIAIKQRLEIQQALVESPGMRQKIVNAMSHLERSNVADDAKRRIVSQIKNGIVRAQRRARESAGNQAVFDEAQEQLRVYESLQSRVPELQAAMDAIINSIALDPQSVEGVMGGVMPNAATLLRNHFAVTARPESTTDNLGNRRNEGLAILRVAADIISRSQQLARRALASQWAEDSEVSREASGIEDRIRQSVDTGTMRQELDRALRSVASLATAAGKAAAVFKIRQRFIVRAFEQFANLQYADQVFNAVLASPEYRALRNSVGAAIGERIVPTAAKGVALESAFRSKHAVVMPDGTSRNFTMAPDRKTWEEQMADTDGRKGIETTLAELRRWIDDPANENDPTRPFYESQHRDLMYLWHGSFVYDSPKIYPAFRRFHFKTVDAFLKQFDSLITNIGIRGSSSLRTIASVMKDSMHLFGDWMTKTDPIYTRAMIEGAKSHADIWSAQTPVDAIDLWYDEVLNPLFASHQDPARPGYRTGEVIPESGRKVTAQDTTARKEMARLSKQSHEIDAVQNRMAVVPSVLVEDTMVPGAPHHRRAMTISEGQMPRRISRKAIDLVSQYLKSEELKQDRFAFWNVPHRFFEVKSMIVNRDAQHSTLSDFEDAFRDVKADLQLGVADSDITDLQSLIDFIEERVDSEPDEVRDFILTEMDRHVRAIASATDALRAQVTEPPSKEFGTTSLKPVDRTSSFTTGRGRAIAPPWAYEYGWRNTRAVMDYAMSGNSFYVELFIKTLLSAADELRAHQKNVVAPRITALEKEHGGNKQKAREVWLKENRENLRLGNDLVEWERIDDFANALEAYARSFNEQYSVGGKETEIKLALGDRILSRFITGVLFGWGTTVRNALEGGFVHNGIRLSRLSGGVFGAFPQAGFSVAKVLLPMFGRAFPALAKGTWQTARNAPRALRTLLTTGNLVKAEGQLLADAIETMATSLMGQSALARGLDRRGLGLPVLPKAVLENQAELWRTSGQIRPVDLEGNPVQKFLQATAQYGATFIDANLALFAKPFFPRVGDVIANEAVADTTFSAIRQLEKRLKILHRTMRDAGMDTSNIGNRQFTPNEVLGRYFGFDRTTTGLRELEGLFIDAQLDFHKSIAEWFQRLDRIGDEQRWLPEDALWRLAMRNVEVINAPTALNRALTIKKNFATRAMGALLGWNLSAYRKYADYIGRSVRDDKTVFRVRLAVALWIFAMLNLAGLSNEAIELIMRRIAELFGDPARATRVPWEFDNPSSAARSHAIYAFNTVPFVATAVNAAFNDMPVKASLSPFLLLQNKALDVLNWVGGAVNSGDPTYKLASLVRGFVPLSSVVINRLPEIAGMREATSVARLYTRYGDQEDLAKPFIRSGPGAAANVTPLSPFGDRIASAVLRGDDQEAAALYTRAVEIAKQLGKPNPEQSVKSLVINRLPISRAFKSTPSAADYSQLLSRMSAGDRSRVERFNATAAVGLAKLGIVTEKLRPLAPIKTTGSTRGRTARSRGYRVQKVRLNRVSRGRLGARRRTRRNSLVRSAI